MDSAGPRWFIVRENSEGGVEVEFLSSPHVYWPATIMQEAPVSRLAMSGRSICLCGKGATWMYAHVAATARFAGARSLQVRLAGAAGTSEDLEGSFCRLVPGGDDRWLINVHLRPQPFLSPGAIERLIAPVLEELVRLCPRVVCLTGKATVDVYARCAWQAVTAGCQQLYCLTPTNGLLLVFSASGEELGDRIPPDWLRALVPPPEKTLIIGIIGDPNSGKSVFAHAFYAYLVHRLKDQRLWLLDCDGQAPTAPWYLSLVQSGLVEQAQAMREQIKRGRGWTPQMQEHIAQVVKRARDFFEVIITDLPGGDLSTDPPQRVPAGRERFFAQTDVLVLLARDGLRTEAAWRQALAAHGLAQRIRVVLFSQDPDAEPKLVADATDQTGVCYGRIQGLNRSRPTWQLAEMYGEAFERIWNALGVSVVVRSDPA